MEHDKTLERLRYGQDFLGGSLPKASAPPAEDAVELWAQRAGRGLALLASVALIGWALATYGTGAP